MTSGRKTKVTEATLVERINARLAEGGQTLVRLDGEMADEYGDWVVTSTPTAADQLGWGPAGPPSHFEQPGVELEKFARELRVLKATEELEK